METPPAVVETPPAPDELPLLRGERAAGRLVQDLVVTLAVLTVLGGAAGGVLALAGGWQPLLAWPVLVALAAVAWAAARLVPAPALPVWSAVALVLTALAFTVWAGTTHAEQVLPRRDSASYLQSAVDLAEHHRRPIAVAAADVGGPQVLRTDGVGLASPAFYAVGTPEDPAIQPQFMVGPSVWWSVAVWLGGIPTAFWAPAVAGGLAVLAVGLLAARTAGPRWAPASAALVALAFPVLHTARSTYSEPLAMLTLTTGLLVLAVAAGRRTRAGASRWAGWVAGGLVGGSTVIRPDALRETMLVLVVGGLALVQGRPHGRPLVLGALASTALGFGLAGLTSARYLGSIAGSLLPLAGLTALVLAVVLAVVRLARSGRRLTPRVSALLPRALAGLVLLTGLALASRPGWLTVRQSALDPGARVVAGLQQRQGLTVDGGRTYAEETVTWLGWWVGPVVLVLALVALTVLTHRAASQWVQAGPLPAWSGPLLVAAGSSVLTLLRPGITPDHPWADRRLLIALPLVLVLAVAALAAATRWATRRFPYPLTLAGTTVVGAALVAPVALATLPHATERVELGELAAVERVCAATAPGDVALTVDARASNEWPQVLRGMCGVPALSTTSALQGDPAALAAAVDRVGRAVASRGGRLLLVGADTPATLRGLGASEVREVVDVPLEEDARLLERRPDTLEPLPVTVWFGRPGGRLASR